jgi:hypothetical protein
VKIHSLSIVLALTTLGVQGQGADSPADAAAARPGAAILPGLIGFWTAETQRIDPQSNVLRPDGSSASRVWSGLDGTAIVEDRAIFADDAAEEASVAVWFSDQPTGRWVSLAASRVADGAASGIVRTEALTEGPLLAFHPPRTYDELFDVAQYYSTRTVIEPVGDGYSVRLERPGRSGGWEGMREYRYERSDSAHASGAQACDAFSWLAGEWVGADASVRVTPVLMGCGVVIEWRAAAGTGLVLLVQQGSAGQASRWQASAVAPEGVSTIWEVAGRITERAVPLRSASPEEHSGLVLSLGDNNGLVLEWTPPEGGRPQKMELARP